MKSAVFVVALLALNACGGHSTEKLVYEGHVLEPKKIIFANVKRASDEFTVAVISDRADYCTQFNGLGCLSQPHLGTALVFRSRVFEKKDVAVGPQLSVRWVDFQGVKALNVAATEGTLKIDDATPEKSFGGVFDLGLPNGRLKDEFTAEFCKYMLEYYLDCPDSQ